MKTAKLSQIVQTLLAQNTARERVQIAVGALVFNESQLHTEWQRLTSNTSLAEVPLHIRIIPASQQCMWCFHIYQPHNDETTCPQCRSVGAKILSGEEFYLE